MSVSVQNITQQINVIYEKYMQEVSHETESIDMEIEQLTLRKQFLVERKRELGQLREKVLSLSGEMDEMEARYQAERERQGQLQLEIEELEALLAAKRKEAAELNGSLEEASALRRAKYEEISALINQFSNGLASKPIPERLDEPDQTDAVSSPAPLSSTPTAASEIELEGLDLDDDPPEISVPDDMDEPDAELTGELVEEEPSEEEATVSTEESESEESAEEDEVEDIDLDSILAELDSSTSEADMDNEEIEVDNELSLVEELSTILDAENREENKPQAGAVKEEIGEEIADLDLGELDEELDLSDLGLDDDEDPEENEDLDQDALEEILSALQNDEK